MHTLFETEDEGSLMPQERAGSHLLGLLNPAMAIVGNLIAIPLVMENSAWAPFVASIGAIWMLGLGPSSRHCWAMSAAGGGLGIRWPVPCAVVPPRSVPLAVC